MATGQNTYGILYTPTDAPPIPTNNTRYRVIPWSSFKALLASRRPGVGITKAALGLIGIALAPGFSGTGEYLYTPDLSSLRMCGYAPGHASVMGWFEEKDAGVGGASHNRSLA